MQAVNAAETSLVLMPGAFGAARREYLAHLLDGAGVDGFLINGQIFASGDEAFEVIDSFRERQVRCLLLFSAEDACSRDFLGRNHPGVYIDEQSALASALAVAAAKGKTRLLFAGVDRYSVERSLDVARRSAAGSTFALEPVLFDELAAKSLFREFEKRLLPELDAATTLVLEGSQPAAVVFRCAAECEGIEAGQGYIGVLFRTLLQPRPSLRGAVQLGDPAVRGTGPGGRAAAGTDGARRNAGRSAAHPGRFQRPGDDLRLPRPPAKRKGANNRIFFELQIDFAV